MAKVDAITTPRRRGKPGPKGPRKCFVQREWLNENYHVLQRPVGEIAREVGCCVEHLNGLVKKHGIPRRDGRVGRVVASARSEIDIDAAFWMYEIKRMSGEQIGEVLGCHGTTVLRALKRSGFPLRHHNDTKRGAKSTNRKEVNERTIIEAYLQEPVTVADIGVRFSVSREVIRRILRENSIPIWPFESVVDRTGQNNANWRSDLTELERSHRRDTAKQSDWRDAVYRRDQHTCKKCGARSRLNAHHIVPHAVAINKRWEISNGITFCVDCHRAFHRTFGLKRIGQREVDLFLSSVIR